MYVHRYIVCAKFRIFMITVFMNITVYQGLRYLFSKAGVGKQAGKRGKTELEVIKEMLPLPPPKCAACTVLFLTADPSP